MSTYYGNLLQVIERRNYTLCNHDQGHMRTYNLYDNQGSLIDNFDIEIKLCLGVRNNRSKLQQHFKTMLKAAEAKQ